MLNNKCLNGFKTELEEVKKFLVGGVDRNIKPMKAELAECNVKSARYVKGNFRKQARLWKLDRSFTCVSSWQRGLNFAVMN